MGIKAKCGGVQVITMRVVLCPNCVYASENKNKKTKKKEEKINT